MWTDVGMTGETAGVLGVQGKRIKRESRSDIRAQNRTLSGRPLYSGCYWLWACAVAARQTESVCVLSTHKPTQLGNAAGRRMRCKHQHASQKATRMDLDAQKRHSGRTESSETAADALRSHAKPFAPNCDQIRAVGHMLTSRWESHVHWRSPRRFRSRESSISRIVFRPRSFNTCPDCISTLRRAFATSRRCWSNKAQTGPVKPRAIHDQEAATGLKRTGAGKS
jgi:hypothetical protein